MKKDLEEITEGESTYKAFRFPTAEIGCVLEYYYIVRRERIFESNSYTLPARHLKEMNFAIIFPDYLNFEIKTYNGLPSANDIADTENKRKCLHLHAENIAKVNNDPMAFYGSHLPRIEFILTHNYSTKRMRINTINDFASSFHQNLTTLDKKEKKDIKSIASQIKVDEKLPLQEKISIIENFIKTNFYYYNISIQTFSNISTIKENKIFNQMGSLRLFFHLLKHFGIEAEIVFTSDKTEKWFDEDFNGTNYFDVVMLYFPKLEQYTSSYQMGLRTGYPNEVAAGQKGVFFREVTVGSTSSFLHDIRYIAPADMRMNADSIDVNISINVEKKEVSATIKRILTGYNGGWLQYNLSDTDYKEIENDDEENEDDEFLNSIKDHFLALDSESMIVDNMQIVNVNKEDVITKPLILTADLKDYYITKTSNDSLWLTIGMFIGKQSDFKQEEPRTLPIERRTNCHYYRTIKVNIPEGYTCLNLNDLNIDVYDEENSAEAQARFFVTTKQEGNQLIIVCQEYYNRLMYSVEEYEKCGRVVQAAADFNNKVLLFKKQ